VKLPLQINFDLRWRRGWECKPVLPYLRIRRSAAWMLWGDRRQIWDHDIHVLL